MKVREQSDAVCRIGRFLTRSEAGTLADRLESGESLIAASKIMSTSRRQRFRDLVKTAELSGDALANVLRAVAGAMSRPTVITPVWTMPGALAQSGPLTTSIPQLIEDARMSISCATFNFQESSQFWDGLRRAAQRPEVAVKVYVDRSVTSAAGNYKGTPTAPQIAAQLYPGRVLRSKQISGKPVRSHAKFLVVDHRFLVVTSANFSWSAENMNVEFGVHIDSGVVAESVERQMADVEESLYEVVPPHA